jgi:uncharacterized protein YcbK (DUF882 family)
VAIKEYSLKKDSGEKLSPHFRVSEFRSKDGADKIRINLNLITVLEKLFTELNCGKINITSGYRTNHHSIAVGGYSGDQHTKGNAADIICYDKKNNIISAKNVCFALERLNHCGGIGYISNTSTHVDVRGEKTWFDETQKERCTNSWYAYFGIKKPETVSTTVSIPAAKSQPVKVQSFFKPCLKNEISIVNALKSVGSQNSYNYRKSIANANNIQNYTGTAVQNIKMLNLLKIGKLIKP